MSRIDLEMREVNKFFENKGISLSCDNIWLRSCMECFRTQSNNYSSKELLDFVFEQWLLADLREVNSYSLPLECSKLEKYIITGKHAIQFNYCVDVSSSSYMQLQKIRRPDRGDNVNIDTERENERENLNLQKNDCKRSLKMEISDGRLTVIGFEDKPIPCLRNPVPGEKALLKGPIECRKGILLLTDKNIEILGGEVDTLLIPNATENVLARLLGQPEDPNPYKQEVNCEPRDLFSSNSIDDDDDDDNEALIMLAESVEKSQASNLPLTQVSNATANSRSQTQSNYENLDFEDDDFDLVAAQTASLAEFNDSKSKHKDSLKQSTMTKFLMSEVKAPLPKNVASTANCSFDSIEEYVDMNHPNRLKRELMNSYGSYQKVQPGSSKSTISNNSGEPARPQSGPSNSSNILQESTYKLPKHLKEDSSIPEESSPSWLLDDVEDMDSEIADSPTNSESNTDVFHQPYPPRKFPSIRTVRGKVIRLSEKLTLKDNQWHLSAIVAANGLEIDMTFSSEVLDKIFGVTATELIAKKNDLKTNPAAKEQMNKLLRDSQLRIKNLSCEMVIRFASVITKPIILDVIQN